MEYLTLCPGVSYLVPHELFALIMLSIQSSRHKCIHLGFVGRGNTPPDFGGTVVQVVQTVKVHVFGVPEAAHTCCQSWTVSLLDM